MHVNTNFSICICIYMLYIYIIMVFTTEEFFRSSYRKLARVGFEPTITEFRSDAQTDWAIKPWVQLALRANFVRLLQFHFFVQCSRFISVFAFVSQRSIAQVITLVAEWIDAYGVHHWMISRMLVFTYADGCLGQASPRFF